MTGKPDIGRPLGRSTSNGRMADGSETIRKYMPVRRDLSENFKLPISAHVELVLVFQRQGVSCALREPS
jgi:hypothetical protein